METGAVFDSFTGSWDSISHTRFPLSALIQVIYLGLELMCFVATHGRAGCAFLNRKEEEWIEEVDKGREEGM